MAGELETQVLSVFCSGSKQFASALFSMIKKGAQFIEKNLKDKEQENNNKNNFIEDMSFNNSKDTTLDKSNLETYKEKIKNLKDISSTSIESDEIGRLRSMESILKKMSTDKNVLIGYDPNQQKFVGFFNFENFKNITPQQFEEIKKEISNLEKQNIRDKLEQSKDKSIDITQDLNKDKDKDNTIPKNTLKIGINQQYER